MNLRNDDLCTEMLRVSSSNINVSTSTHRMIDLVSHLVSSRDWCEKLGVSTSATQIQTVLF